MEHDEATRLEAAERYVAHELSAAERDDFEEHFFECPRCADEVRFELVFAANMRAVSRDQRAEQSRSAHSRRMSWWEGCTQWLRLRPAMSLSFAANLFLVAGIGYFLMTGVRQSPEARFTQPYFAPGPTHGGEDVHVVPAGEPSYMVRFPAAIPASQSYSYSYEVLDAAGKREASGSMKAPDGAEEFLFLQVPVLHLPIGVHVLVVRGGAAGEIVSWSKFRTSH